MGDFIPYFLLKNPAANDAAYVEATGDQQVVHKDLQPRDLQRPNGQKVVALSCFIPLTPCPHDGTHGGWVVANASLHHRFVI